MNTVLQVMISSTFFDLKQVRANLAGFLREQLGYTLLMSEWSSFPIDPDVDTIENCRRRVEREADVLVLIIGGRYGFVDSSSSKSVTNIEYLAARAKGIPIYAFVERGVLAVLPAWKANKNSDFSSVVDDPRIFEFVDEVRNLHKVWMRDFDLADEIVESLRVQFAYLALQGARLIRQTRDSREASFLSEISGIPLRIALEKPPGWEYKLFAEVLIQEIRARQGLKDSIKLGIAFGPHENVTRSGFGLWSDVRMAELSRMVEGLTTLVNVELKRALGPMGEPGDTELLVFIARSVGSLYQEALEWGLRIRRVVPEADLVSVVRSMEGFVDDILAKVEALGPLLLREIDRLEQADKRGEPVPTGSVSLSLELPGVEQFSRAADKLSRKLRLR